MSKELNLNCSGFTSSTICKGIQDGMQFVSSTFIWSHQDSVPKVDILRGMVALRNSDELE
jgi:uncharacterized protein Usg